MRVHGYAFLLKRDEIKAFVRKYNSLQTAEYQISEKELDFDENEDSLFPGYKRFQAATPAHAPHFEMWNMGGFVGQVIPFIKKDGTLNDLSESYPVGEDDMFYAVFFGEDTSSLDVSDDLMKKVQEWMTGMLGEYVPEGISIPGRIGLITGDIDND